jgi:8-oxo-dGTP pyrophosphatase MutT (NUDIX family)
MEPQIGFLRHVHYAQRYNRSLFMPFVIAGRTVGSIRREVGLVLGQEFGFRVEGDTLILQTDPDTTEYRTKALAHASVLLSNNYQIGLTRELYPVLEAWGEESLATIDRAAIPWFGTLGVGVHVNGFVRGADGALSLWVGKRAASRRIDPAKLDNVIGGGHPLGYTLQENLEKEGMEEAGFPPAIMARAKRVGALHYQVEMMKGLRNDLLFMFDLELQPYELPCNTDGEVESFTLMPAAEVLQLVHDTDAFKFNCNLVIIDFLLRHGVLTPAHPAYAAVIAAMAEVRAQGV